MIFRQILHPATGCASYILGCTGKKALAVVDPHLEHNSDYLAVAEAARSPIVAIVETHVQADHLSGSPALAERTGASIYLHESAEVAFPHRTVRDGDELPLGNDYLGVLHTPGHSPDSICLLVGDRTRGPDPWFLLTGDTLFVGDAGRPDLTADAPAGSNAPIAAALTLYESLQELLALPDDLEIFPAHFAGSACGRTMSGKPSSTLGFERRFNPALQPRSPKEFVTFMLADLPPAPERHREIRAANRRGDTVAASTQ
ncbi:MAG TPA: MBL fold metallo-hydrolase [Ktedonobacterales bacterium]|jgi:glyoxylase-like metal-dependent hydrolase (beta-lactamase superfamily II)|nr:MBL fold metallo-hydrolase [Ktedonobacterales bacterium]